MRIAIIGGGIIGSLTALHLKERGAEPVIIERGRLGGEASWAGAGILCPIQPWLYPDAFTHLVDASLALYPDLQEQLLAESGISIEWRRCGMLVPFFDEDDDSQRAAALDWSGRFDWQVEALDPEAAWKDEPTLSRNGLSSALLWPQVAQLRNPRLLQAVHARLEQLGIETREECEVAGLLEQGDRVSGVRLTDGESIEADAVLLASGSWSGAMAEAFGMALPVQPVKGQIVLLKDEPGRMQRIIKHHRAYFVPRADGRILVGASMENAGFARGNTVREVERLLQALLRIVPGLESAEVERQWMGFRPGSPDGLPFIGPVASRPGLWVASGHYRNGVALAPITAEVVSGWMLGMPPAIDMAPFAVERDVHSSTQLGYPQGETA